MASRQIKSLQKSTKLLNKVSFQRLVKDIRREQSNHQVTSWQRFAINSLQESTDTFLVNLVRVSRPQPSCDQSLIFPAPYLCTIYGKRVTLQAKDVQRMLQILDTSKLPPCVFQKKDRTKHGMDEYGALAFIAQKR